MSQIIYPHPIAFIQSKLIEHIEDDDYDELVEKWEKNKQREAADGETDSLLHKKPLDPSSPLRRSIIQSIGTMGTMGMSKGIGKEGTGKGTSKMALDVSSNVESEESGYLVEVM